MTARSELASSLTAVAARSPELQTCAARNPTSSANTIPIGGSSPGEIDANARPRSPGASNITNAEIAAVASTATPNPKAAPQNTERPCSQSDTPWIVLAASAGFKVERDTWPVPGATPTRPPPQQPASDADATRPMRPIHQPAKSRGLIAGQPRVQRLARHPHFFGDLRHRQSVAGHRQHG